MFLKDGFESEYFIFPIVIRQLILIINFLPLLLFIRGKIKNPFVIVLLFLPICHNFDLLKVGFSVHLTKKKMKDCAFLA